MANWFTKALDVITPWDRGGEVQRRQEDEEERRRRAEQQRATIVGPSNQTTAWQPPQRQDTPNFGTPPQPQQMFVNKPKQKSRLEQLKEQEMARALEEEKKRTSWFGRQIYDRNWDKRAESYARNRALNKHMEETSWKPTQETKDWTKGTKTLLSEDNMRKGSMNPLVTPLANAGRVTTGIAQGFSGLWDLASPADLATGTFNMLGAGDTPAANWMRERSLGTSGISKALDEKARGLDEVMKAGGLENQYKVGNVGGEVASYFLPGVGASKLSKYANKLDDAAKWAGRGNTYATRVAQELLDPKNMALEARMGNRYIGQQAARGEEVTPLDIILEYGMALPTSLATNAGSEFISRAIKHLRRGADEPIGAASSGLVASGSHLLGEVAGESAEKAVKGVETPPVDRVSNVEAPSTVKPGEIAPGIVSPTKEVADTTPPPQVTPPSQAVDAPSDVAVPEPTVPARDIPSVEPPQKPVTQISQAPEQLPQKPQELPKAEEIQVPEPVKVEEPQVKPEAVQENKTPIQEKSEQVVQESTPTITPEQANASRIESLKAEREALRESGLPTAEIDRQIRALEGSEVKIIEDPEADKLVGEQKPTVDKTVQSAKNEKAQQYRDMAKNAKSAKEKAAWNKMAKALESGDVAQMVAANKALQAVGKTPADAFAKAPAPKTDTKLSKKPAKTVVEAETKPESPTPEAPKSETNLSKTKNERTPSVKTEEKAPAKSLYDEANENLTKSGKVSEKWRKAKIAEGADPDELAKVKEKIEGRQAPKTTEEKKVEAERAEVNEANKERKAEAEQEGTIEVREAAPRLAKQLNKTHGPKFKAYVKKFKMNDSKLKYVNEIADVDDADMIKYADDFLTSTKNIDEAEHIIKAQAIARRLDDMGKADKTISDKIGDMLDNVEATVLEKASRSGQTQRAIREFYASMPASMRVKRTITKMQEKFDGVEVSKADQATLTKHLEDFDARTVDISAKELKTKELMDQMLNPRLGARKRAKLMGEFKKTVQEREAAKEAAVKANQEYSDVLRGYEPKASFKDKLFKGPDYAGNYLRMAMLSAPSGRARDVFTTTLNVVDQSMWRTMEAVLGKGLNQASKKTKYTSTIGGWAARKKGWNEGVSKLKKSYKGEPTIDEALGYKSGYDRSELKDGISTYQIGKAPGQGNPGKLRTASHFPKKFIRATVQAPTDLTYSAYTKTLYAEGKRLAEEAGLKGPAAKQYAEMFMESPTEEATKKAGQRWLENSGMHDNELTRTMKGWADKLDQAGSSKTWKDGSSRSYSTRLAMKASARLFRTTTIPFVQYTAGATNAMLKQQNPAYNYSKSLISILGKSKDPQMALEQFARGTWNTAKIAGLVGAIYAGKIQISETAEDGEKKYGSPYVVVGDKYIPMGSFGIAIGSGINYANSTVNAIKSVEDGDVMGAIKSVTWEPFWNTLKATGLDNSLSGENVFGGVFSSVARSANSPDDKSIEYFLGGMIGDIGTQATPALGRDIISFLDQNDSYNPTHEKADTSAKYADGTVNPIQKGINQIKAGIPGMSNTLPRKSGENARTFGDRIYNADTQSEQQKAAIAEKQKETQSSVKRISEVSSNPDLVSLMSDESKAIYDKYNGKLDKASDADRKKIWDDIYDKKEKLIDDKKWGSYAEVLQKKLDEDWDGLSSSEGAKRNREVARAKVAQEQDADPRIFRLYTSKDTEEGGGISQDELKKMLDPESDYYDPETANALIALDEAMTKAGVSSNTKGLDPWTRNKYNLDEILGRGKYAKKGGSKKIGSKTVGLIGNAGKPSASGSSIPYKDVRSVPQISAMQPRKAPSKKKISVARGVQL